jgi:hypothetical protein
MAKRPSKNKRQLKNQSSGDQEAVFLRNESLRLIIHRAFAEQGAQAGQADAELSTKLSEEMLRLLEQTEEDGNIVRRCAQLFATVKLLEISEHGHPAPLTTAEFVTDVLGLELASTMTKSDYSTLDPINAAMTKLLTEPQWVAVHNGHIAMGCMSLLSLYDISFLN